MPELVHEGSALAVALVDPQVQKQGGVPMDFACVFAPVRHQEQVKGPLRYTDQCWMYTLEIAQHTVGLGAFAGVFAPVRPQEQVKAPWHCTEQRWMYTPDIAVPGAQHTVGLWGRLGHGRWWC